MKLATWFVAVVLAGIGCDTAPSAPDAGTTPAKGPPTGFTFYAIGERSFASFGWSGIIHNVRVPDDTPFGVRTINCDGVDGTGVCAFDGPKEPDHPVKRRRCLNRMSRLCAADSECPDDGTPFKRCVFIYDPPTPTSLTGLMNKKGSCGWSYIPVAAAGATPTIVGTLDQTSGELNMQNITIFLPQNGPSGGFRGACAQCMGDVTQNDGVKEGTCVSLFDGDAEAVDPSPDIGTPCDVHRYANTGGFSGGYSMDCSPSVRLNDGNPNAFGGTFTSSGYQISITEASPPCTDPKFMGQKCFCGMCPDNMRACSSNADCGGLPCGALPMTCDPNPPPMRDDGTLNPDFNPMFAPEQCRGTGLQMLSATRGNSCRGGVCSWDPNVGLGTCISTLNNQLVGCYPHGVGQSIKAEGRIDKRGDVYIVDTATARCTRAQASPIVNGQLGLPGLTFQRRSFRIVTEFPK